MCPASDEIRASEVFRAKCDEEEGADADDDDHDHDDDDADDDNNTIESGVGGAACVVGGSACVVGGSACVVVRGSGPLRLPTLALPRVEAEAAAEASAAIEDADADDADDEEEEVCDGSRLRGSETCRYVSGSTTIPMGSPSPCKSPPSVQRPLTTTTTTASSSPADDFRRCLSGKPQPSAAAVTASPRSGSSSSSFGAASTCWWMRGSSVNRRFSGAASDFTSDFSHRISSLRGRLGRRRSLSSDDLRYAELQRKQYAYLQEMDSLTHRVVSPAYRRSISASTLNLVHEAFTNSRRRSSGNGRQRSTPQVLGEIWPETVTGLLTGQQPLIDRSLLLTQLALKPPSPEFDEEDRQQQQQQSRPLMLLAGGCTVARPDKLEGEDSYFVAEGAIGVADGVGEWTDFGCNARDFAVELMEGAERFSRSLDLFRGESSAHKALRCIRAGYANTVSYGSSTCLVACLAGRELGLANLGDSTGLVLRRDGTLKKVFMTLRRTKEQQHFFNCPFQLSKIPRKDELRELENRGLAELARVVASDEEDGDRPEMANLYDVKVQPGDLVILGTDGLFDNLFDQEVAALVSLTISPTEAKLLDPFLESARTGIVHHPNASIPPQKDPLYGIATPPEHIARALAGAAFHRSQDPRARTPFGRQSRRHGTVFHGGKLDDITVVAAWVA